MLSSREVGQRTSGSLSDFAKGAKLKRECLLLFELIAIFSGHYALRSIEKEHGKRLLLIPIPGTIPLLASFI
jgi:hypothetical protein